MELFNQNTIENGFLICNKTEQHKPIIELLYESRKRTGGDDIKELHFDRSLNQYLCIYYKPETCKNVLKHGPVTFHQTVFLPMQIDRTKIILENVDEALEMDTVSLYADYLFQDMIRNGPTLKVERLKSGFVLIDLDCSYDIERLKARHRKRSRLQNKDILLHFVAKTDGSTCASFYTQILMKRPIFNSSPDVKLNLIPAVKKQDTPTVCRSLVLIQDSDEETSISSTSSGYSSISTMSQKTNSATNSECCSSSSSSSPLTVTSSSSNLRTMEMRLRMFEGLVGNLKKVLDMASSSSSSPSSSASNSPRPQSPNQPQPQLQQQHKQQPKPDQTVETSLTKSSPQPQPQQQQQQHQHQSSAEFAPPIITLNRVTQSSGIMPRTGLVRVRNIVQEMPVTNNSTSQNRPHPFSSIIHQQNRSNPSAALNLRRMILNHANGHSHPHLVAPSAPSPINGGGLSLSMIARFPIIIYQRPLAQNSTATNTSNNNSCCSSSKCSICLESFKNNQEVRLLSCFHQFHVECIDTWLMEKSTCPTCKFNLALACHTE